MLKRKAENKNLGCQVQELLPLGDSPCIAVFVFGVPFHWVRWQLPHVISVTGNEIFTNSQAPLLLENSVLITVLNY